MRIIYLERTLLWIILLIYTLFKFWLKNLHETKAILNFISEKIIALPKFLSRNVLIEEHSQAFGDTLLQTANLYEKYGKSFNPRKPNSYRKMDKILSDKLQILYFLVRKLKPTIVLETGVAGGESTGYILQAMKDNKSGQLYSLDLPFQWYIYGSHKLHLDSLPIGKMPGYLVPRDLKKRWILTLGNTHDKLAPILKKLGKIDIFFHDSEHTEKTMRFEYQIAWPYIKKGGYLVSDDVSYTETFNKFSKLTKKGSIIFKDIGVVNKNR